MISRTAAFCVLALSFCCLAAGGAAPAPEKTTSIADFGAVGNGTTLNTKSIQSAVDHVAANGGGTLVIPKGTFLSGAIFLKPGVNLHLEEGAVLKGSTDRKDYPRTRTRIEGHFEEWLPALVNAERTDHLRVSGSGMLDGSGKPFWEEFWTRLNADEKTKNLDVPRPRLMLVQNSRDVNVSGITFKDSGFWNLHLYRCRDVLVENARFEVADGIRCPSTDGTDIDSCSDVTIRGCTYRVDDDCIAVKGSKGPLALDDTDSPPVENILVTDCTFERGHGVVTLGSEATVVRNVRVEKCRVRGSIAVVRLKLRPDTPQHYEGIHYRDIELDGDGAIIEVQPWTQYFDLKGQEPPKSIVRNVTLTNVTGRYGSFGTLMGNPGQTTISDVKLTAINVTLKSGKLKTGDVKDLTFRDVTVNGHPYPAPPAE